MNVLSAVRVVWLAGIGLHVLLAVVLIGKRTWRTFPIFTCYTLFNLFETAVCYFLRPNSAAYFYAYVIGETISVGLGLALVYEVFVNLFHPHPGLRRLAKVVFRVMAAFLFLLAAGVIYAHKPFNPRDLLSALLVVEEAARIVEVGLIMFLFLFSSIFGLHWRQFVFGMALGFGFYVTIKLAEVTLLPRAHSLAAVWTLIGVLAFDMSLLVWLMYAVAPERVTQKVELPNTGQLERWNQAIMELINQ